MEEIFPFESILVFSSLAVFLLIGVILRAKISFLQKFLIPSCLIGGLIAMVIRNAGFVNLPVDTLELIVYHLFNISFISVGLTPGSKARSKESGKEQLAGPLGMGLLQGVIFPIQAIIGGLFTLLFINIGLDLFPTFGFLTPLGFIEGPGQALSFGQTWESAPHLFANATVVGLTFAAIGFFFAFFVGVPLVNWAIRKGLSDQTPKKLPTDFVRGIISKNQEKANAGFETTHPANVDVVSFHFALVGVAYIATYGLVSVLTSILPTDIAKMFWGFFFFFGLLIAILIRLVIKKLDLDYLVDRDIQKRITGWSVDFLIVATITAIELAIVWTYILPISLISLTTGITTVLVVFYLGKRMWQRYAIERIAGIYGTVTGTVPSGLLLIRILDPEYRTPAAIDLGLTSIFAAPFILSGLLLVNAPVLWGWSVEQTVLVFVGMLGISLLLIRLFGLWGKPQF
jgi:ESS family glutamate:Na+ symporter